MEESLSSLVSLIARCLSLTFAIIDFQLALFMYCFVSTLDSIPLTPSFPQKVQTVLCTKGPTDVYTAISFRIQLQSTFTEPRKL